MSFTAGLQEILYQSCAATLQLPIAWMALWLGLHAYLRWRFYRSIRDDLIYNHLSFDGGPVERRAALDVGGWAKDG